MSNTQMPMGSNPESAVLRAWEFSKILNEAIFDLLSGRIGPVVTSQRLHSSIDVDDVSGWLADPESPQQCFDASKVMNRISFIHLLHEIGWDNAVLELVRKVYDKIEHKEQKYVIDPEALMVMQDALDIPHGTSWSHVMIRVALEKVRSNAIFLVCLDE